jgi:Uma2 family endonuclease
MTPPLDSGPLTAEELASIYIPGKSTELVRGRLVVREPPSTEHGRIQATLAYFVTDYVRRNGLGVVFGQDTGFKIRSDPDTVRAADVAFLGQDRASGIPTRGYAAIRPDLVAEIVSPDDRPGEILEKVAEWLDAGAALVWVVDPQRHVAQVYRSDGNLTIVGADGRLDGEDVIPGFSCALTGVLA